MKLTFCGGAGMVTGANYFLQSGNEAILIDCGLKQGSRFAEEANYHPFQYDPFKIRAVFVTHAHIDHIGLLPRLVQDGFSGKVYSTEPTKALSQFLLEDAERLMREEAFEHHHEKPLYEPRHIEELMMLWQGVKYHEEIVLNNFKVEFWNAGHILGSSFIRVTAEGKTIVFSGDLGNSPPPLIQPTEQIQDVHYCLTESTYGNRVHESPYRIKEVLEDVIEDAAKAQGVLMIPAFAMERTQDLLFHLNELMEQGRVPKIPIYMDSPLAIKLTQVYEDFRGELNTDTLAFLKKGKKLFDFPNLTKTVTTEESKAINEAPVPKVIIAGSGMSNGGRILHHERRYLSDPKSTILFVGYQAVGSLGRNILDGKSFVKIFGEEIPVRAKIKTIEAYSAHADQPQLMRWLEPMRLTLKRVFVVQGEEDQSEPLAQKIRDELAVEADVPKPGAVVEL